MSPVFRHGRLRLYLLKLLDEAPRHGYEVIRLLQDRFMGVYAPSPGTIYPRLARLEEDGLVTHEEVDGKKVYSITDKGREEIRARLGDLADLEDELTESLRDVAREISVDVRDTVRSIREELASAAREFRGQEGGPGDRARSSKSPGGDKRGGQRSSDGDEPHGVREEARRSREQMRADFRGQGRGRPDWAGWTAWSEWASGKDWTGATDWTGGDWAGNRDWTGGKDRAGGREPASGGGGAAGADSAASASAAAGADPAADSGTAAGADSAAGGGTAASGHSAPGDEGRSGRSDAESSGQQSRRGGPNPFSDLERIAIQFATELRAAARQTGGLGERSLNDLRDILTDTLAKVRVEVFNTTDSRGNAAENDASKPTSDDHGANPASQPDDSAQGQARRSS